MHPQQTPTNLRRAPAIVAVFAILIGMMATNAVPGPHAARAQPRRSAPR